MQKRSPQSSNTEKAHRELGRVVSQYTSFAVIEAMTSCLAEIVVSHVQPEERKKILHEINLVTQKKVERIASAMVRMGIPDRIVSRH